MKHKESKESSFLDAVELLLVVIILFFLVNTIVGCVENQGPRGLVGAQGAKGDPGLTVVGPQGPTGASGSDGYDGVDLTPVTIVNLCPGIPSYPGVFVEVAICLQGQLFGVYSANGGFLTLLSPGNYSSNAIGSACDLTISPNCIVT